MKVLNPGPEEIRDHLVVTGVDQGDYQYDTKNERNIDVDNHVLGVLSNNKWNVGPFLQEILRLLKQDVQDLEIEFQKKLNASQTVNQDLVAPIVERTNFAITGIGD